MEVFDFEDDHLASVLPNDRDDDEEEDTVDRSKIFVSPTEQETRSKLAADKQRGAHNQQPIRRHHDNHFRGVSIETDTSSQRYQHLPSYAQTTFVEKSESVREIPKDLPSGMLLVSECLITYVYPCISLKFPSCSWYSPHSLQSTKLILRRHLFRFCLNYLSKL